MKSSEIVKLKAPGLMNYGFSSMQNNQAPIDFDRVERLIPLCKSLFKPIKSLNKRHSSYSLKHVVENIIGDYVSNGELISAMIILGYSFKIAHYDSPNCYFNVSAKYKKHPRYRAYYDMYT